MRGILVPDVEEDFTADPVELFFDLAFVFAFSRLVAHLVHHPDLTGAAEALLLFLLIWFSWSMFTWGANAISGNGRLVRLVFLIATAVTVPMAASVETAFGAGGLSFALSGATIILMAGVLSLTAFDRTSDQFQSMLRFIWPSLIGVTVFIIGGVVDGGARVALWLLTLVILFGTTVASGSTDWMFRPGHFAERHGLIMIIALGEVVVAIGISVVGGLDEGGLTTNTQIGLTAAGALAGLLWWSYFDRVQPALEYRAEQLEDRARSLFGRDAYTYCHAPIIGGVIAAAAAAEEALLHPDEPLHVEFRIMLAAGFALFAVGVGSAVYRAFKVIARERIVGVVAIVALCAFAGDWPAVWLLVAIDLLLLLALVAENLRVEGRGPSEPDADSAPEVVDAQQSEPSSAISGRPDHA